MLSIAKPESEIYTFGAFHILDFRVRNAQPVKSMQIFQNQTNLKSEALVISSTLGKESVPKV